MTITAFAGAVCATHSSSRLLYPAMRLFGMQVSSMGLAETVQWLDENVLARGAQAAVFTANVDHVVRLSRDAAFRECYHAADMVTADGTPLVWLARMAGSRLPRVTGIDLVHALCGLAAARQYPCYFLGSRPEVLSSAVAALQRAFPALPVAGMQNGYFDSDAEVIESINRSGAAVLFLGMGSPKQEAWLARHIQSLNCHLALPVGGSFDVIAGRKRRAPVLMQTLGAEWVWRMCQEPRRLWRRYLIEDAAFLPLALRELCRR